MSQKIINDEGVEVEVFTADELQAQKDAIIEEFKASNPDKSEELTNLQKELQAKEAELLKLKDKDLNFSILRQSKEKLEKEVKTLTESVDDKIMTAKREILEGVMKDHYLDTVKKLVGDDKDLLAKVELQYKRLADPAATKDEISKKLNDAFILATSRSPGTDNSAFSSAGAVKPKIDTISKLSEEEKQMARELAAAGGIKLEEKDFK